MRKSSGERLYLVRIAGNKVRQYTKARLIYKLATGKITPGFLVYSGNGAWLPVRETHGFRTVCAKLEGKSAKNTSPEKSQPVPLPDRILKKVAETEINHDPPPHLKKTVNPSSSEEQGGYSASKIIIPSPAHVAATEPESWMLGRGFIGKVNPSEVNSKKNSCQNNGLEELLEQLLPKKNSEGDLPSSYGFID